MPAKAVISLRRLIRVNTPTAWPLLEHKGSITHAQDILVFTLIEWHHSISDAHGKPMRWTIITESRPNDYAPWDDAVPKAPHFLCEVGPQGIRAEDRSVENNADDRLKSEDRDGSV